MAEFTSKVDIDARKKAGNILRSRFIEVMNSILNGKEPVLVIPKRTLSNTIYDRDRKLLLIGEDVFERRFLDSHEARRFMQTILMASIIYQALVNNEYPTIRDLYYRGKHTIKYRDYRGRIREENTWDEQSESDSVLRDIEVYTNLLREEMLILSKEKGKVVGDMRIKSGDDIIDLSKMGHGAYAIESTPDLIEFKDVNAEFVLVIEKDAVFQQLHRAGFWKKYKALLITSAGQPDRATRRFVRRLSEELKLPVYILTDSIPGSEIILVENKLTHSIEAGAIGDILDPYFTGYSDKEWAAAPIKALAMNGDSLYWSDVSYVYRHWIEDEILRIYLDGYGYVEVTKGHSLFRYRGGTLEVAAAKDIGLGDHVLVARSIPQIPISSLWKMFSSFPTLRDQLEDLCRDAYIGADSDTARAECISRVFEAVNASNGGSELRLDVFDTETGKVLIYTLLSLGVRARVIDAGGSVYLEVLGSPDLRSRLYRMSRGETIGSPEIYRAKVTGIEEYRYSGYVYDLAVPNGNSFFGGFGAIYHNSDPYGFYIYSVFKVGSITLSYESERLATPEARFLGVSMSDIFGDPKGKKKPYLSEAERRNYIIRAKDTDLKRAKELKQYKWFQTKKWLMELSIFEQKKAKLEIEALTSKGLRFLMDTYIPTKISTGDWID